MSTRSYGDMRFGKLKNEDVIANRKSFCQDLSISLDEVVVANLVHSSKIALVGQEERGKGTQDRESAISKTDGLVSTKANTFLMMTVFDCLPVLFYDPTIQAVGVVHAGWRGIIDKIIDKTVEKFANVGSNPNDLIVGIGPAICQKHFVVKSDVLENFRENYPKATFVRNHDGYVNLKEAVLIDLKKHKIPNENIEVSIDCPSCHNGRYGSFRKEGESAPASAVIIGMRNGKS